MRITRPFLNAFLWFWTIIFIVLTVFAVSGAWNVRKHMNFGEHMAVTSSVAGPLIVATVILFVASVLTIETIDDDDLED